MSPIGTFFVTDFILKSIYFPIWTTVLDNSVLKLLSYGPRLRIHYSWSWKYLEIWFLQFSRILEVLEIWCFYFVLSWKYWKLKSSTFSIILEIRAAGGRLQGLGSVGLGLFWNIVPEKVSLPNISYFVFSKIGSMGQTTMFSICGSKVCVDWQ